MIEKRLGRGLESLISATAPSGDRQVVEIDLDRIQPNPDQPRDAINQATLEGLAVSIEAHGVIQPIVVQRISDGYQIVAGERRFRASRLAGRPTIPALVIDAGGGRSLELALIENIQREDLGALEEAAAFEALLARGSLTHAELAKRVGRSRAVVSNALRLLELPEEVKGLLRAGVLSAGQARAILGAETPEAMIAVATQAARQRWSVREVEQRVRTRKPGPTGGHRRSARRRSKKNSFYEEEIRLLYGTRASIKESGGRGSISLEFYSQRDRDRLLQLLIRGAKLAAESEADKGG